MTDEKDAKELLAIWDALCQEVPANPEAFAVWLRNGHMGLMTEKEIMEMTAAERAQECGQ